MTAGLPRSRSRCDFADPSALEFSPPVESLALVMDWGLVTGSGNEYGSASTYGRR